MINIKIYVLVCFFFLVFNANAQDTTIIKSLNYNSQTRDTMVSFPEGNESYRKVLMLYNMRCKGARVSTGSNRNLGCGEWDYSCNTYITDSTQSDSFLSNIAKYSVAGFSGPSMKYTTKPQYNYFRDKIYNKLINNTISETVYPMSGSTANNEIFSQTPQKKYMVYTAADLNNAGFSAGKINGIILGLIGAGVVNNLQVKIALSADSVLDINPENIAYTKVYHKNLLVLGAQNRLMFHQDFIWDGFSHLVFQISHNGASSAIDGAVFNLINAQHIASVNSSALKLNGASYVETNTYKGVLGNAERTIDVWIKTSRVNGEICSWGTDRTGEKWVFRVNDNGALRVEVNGGNIVGTTLVNDNKWHHVACVLKGGQVSDIDLFVDGAKETVASISSIAVNTSSGINVRVSRGVNNRYFSGEMDELHIWDKALTENEVKQAMFLAPEAMPNVYLNLVLHYAFNASNALVDGSVNGNNAVIVGDLETVQRKSGSFNNAFTIADDKPAISWIRGDYLNTIDSSQFYNDSLLRNAYFYRQNAIASKPKAISDDSVYVVEKLQIWNTDEKSYFFENGKAYDSATAQLEKTVEFTETLPYFRRYPSSLEIMSFVTPYGINLDMGVEGKTWVFDLTDFTPILKGKKRMFLSRGGENQEEMDIQFLFIKGTPPREVKSIQQIWPTSIYQPNFTQILQNQNFFPEVEIAVSEGLYKVRSAITGHGQQGEFIPRNHTIFVNGDAFTQRVWKNCGDNPVYPQGGTWIYDRAGWCPGMATDVAEYEIGAYTKDKTSVKLDYTIESGDGDSRYIINNQLVKYGDWNHNLDAELIDIMEPTSRVEYAKDNPMCINPKVLVKNTGKQVITSINFNYWVNGGQKSNITWNGNLATDKTAEINLSINQGIWSSANGTNDKFYTEIVQVNGQADDEIANNLAYSSFELPEVFPNEIILFMRGNSNAGETAVKITDDWGNVRYEITAMENNKSYRDTVKLGLGCHTLTVEDNDGDGISFFANQDGAGFIRVLKVGGGFNRLLQPDFGERIELNFTVTHPLDLPKYKQPFDITCYPNPTSGKVFLDGSKLENSTIRVYNNLGQMVNVPQLQSIDHASLDFSQLPKGFYAIAIEIDGKISSKKVLVE